MATSTANPSVIRFGPFEADLRTGELRKFGTRIKLQDQPFQVLVMLLAVPGELVTREEIQRALWPQDTFVDFDHGLNTAIRRLRDALSDSADNPKWIETLPRRGYRFLGQVEQAIAEPATTTAPAIVPGGCTNPIPPATPADARAAAAVAVSLYRRREAWAGIIIVVLVVAGLLIWHPWHTVSADAIDSIAVLPFVNEAKDPELDYLSDGIAETIMSNLAQLPTLHVMSRNSAFSYKGRNVGRAQIARELNVRALLLGSVRQQSDDLHINLELVDSRDGRQLWSENFDLKRTELVTVQQQIARQTFDKLRLQLNGEQRQSWARRHRPAPAAYDLYLRGQQALNRRTNARILEGLQYFQQAVDIDPSYPEPYLGMAAAYGLLSFYGGLTPASAGPRSDAASRRAFELDPASAAVQAQMGYVFYRHRDFAAAERAWKRAIEIEPGNADAHHAYAMFLSERGRDDEAMQESLLSEKFDPLWPGNSATTSWILVYAHRYPEAERHAFRTDSGFPPAYWVLGQVYEQTGRYEQAVEAFRTATQKVGPHTTYDGYLAHALVLAGHKAEAQKLLAEMVVLHKQSYYSAFHIALSYLALGDRQAALQWLNTAVTEEDPWMNRLRDPRLDPIRSSPEFAAIQRAADAPR